MEQNLNSPNYNLPEDDNLDIKRYISLFISNWYWFAISLLIALSAAYGINRYSPPVYTVSATLLIKDDQVGSVSSNLENVLPGGNIFKNWQNLKNEMGILRSLSLNEKVMAQLKDFHVIYVSVGKRKIVESRLYKTCPFIVLYDSLELEPIGANVGIEILKDNKYKIKLDEGLNFDTTMSFGMQFKKHGFNFMIVSRDSGRNIYSDNSSNNYYFCFADPKNLANQYRGSLSVSPIEKDASIVTISASGLDPVQEADYINKLMDVYISYGLEYKIRTAGQTIKFINEQIGIISDSLNLAEANLEKFRRDNSFFNLSSEGVLFQNQLEKIENDKAAFELQLQYYNYLSEYLSIKNSGGTVISPSVIGISDGVLLRLINELYTNQKEKEKLSFNLEDNQVALEFMDKQADEIKKALKENIKNGIAGLELSITGLVKKKSIVDMEMNKLPTTERELIKIQRKFDLNNTVYTFLLEKRAEAGIARASNIPDNRIIDYASDFSASQISPRTRLNFITALMLGLLIPVTLIIMIFYFNDKVIDKKDIENKTKVPVIGYIGHNETKNEIPVVEKPGSALAESFRSVRTSIKYYVRENEKSVISVSSTISSEGKTFISINLAAITAQLGKKVLLIGLDLRKPRIDKVFEFESSPGMSNYLSGNCNYEEVIKQTQIKNLFYAPSGPIPPNPAELIETERMKIFMETAGREFDFIFLDTPPVAVVTDALLLAPFVNLNLFIVRQRYTSRNTLELIEQLYRKGELKNMALVLNDISLSGYYGYGIRYGYYLGYGYSYGNNYYGDGYYRRYGYKDKAKEYYVEEG